MEYLKEYASNIVIISVLSTIFEIVIPEGKNKKVATIVIGLVVMLTVMEPLKYITTLNRDIDFPTFEIEESFEDYEENLVADVFEENLAQSIKDKVRDSLNKNILCDVSVLRNEAGEIIDIESVIISPYDDETALFIESEFAIEYSLIEGERHD